MRISQRAYLAGVCEVPLQNSKELESNISVVFHGDTALTLRPAARPCYTQRRAVKNEQRTNCLVPAFDDT